ncbi:MAG: CYTH domain-containing protein [Spirochaetaceae bacterium]|jgi:adenylate cyclase class 2|nr:CYTH domain-containing protein [Spirochaetaceae bacterium]
MATEIELKAHVDDPESLRKIIASLGIFSGSFEKSDVYWQNPNEAVAPGGFPAYGVRIRRETRASPNGESAQTVATYKTRETRGGIEVNDEREFTVSDAGNFEELLRRLGLVPGIRKCKRGWAWNCEGITAELAEVSGIGWFAELEILAGEDTPEIVASARSRLLAFLRGLGIGEDKIETRPYTVMVQESRF